MEADIWEPITNDCQSEFDQFYATALGLLNKYYPERTITITSRDPEYIAPDIKAKLRRKNKLMTAGRIEEADALAERIGTDITKQNSTRLRIFVFMNCIISRLALRAQNNACNFFRKLIHRMSGVRLEEPMLNHSLFTTTTDLRLQAKINACFRVGERSKASWSITSMVLRRHV